MRRLTALAGGLAALALAYAPAAQAAGSDSYTTATPLTYSVGDSADTTSFTTQPGEPGTTTGTLGSCATYRTNTAWWSVRGHGGRMTVTTQGTDIDAVLAVYVRTASGAPGTEVTLQRPGHASARAHVPGRARHHLSHPGRRQGRRPGRARRQRGRGLDGNPRAPAGR